LLRFGEVEREKRKERLKENDVKKGAVTDGEGKR
jgi:hypothetical protein